MKLRKLFKDIKEVEIKGTKDLEINGICSNSKLVAPGNLFIAKKGRIDDGSHYIGEALAAGAVAVLTDLYDPFVKATQIIHPDVAGIEGLLASHYYQFPSRELFMVGITGTNGKTTTSFLTKYLLDVLDGPSGLIGTIEYIIGKHRYKATRTTPDVVSNHKMLREMCLQGCHSAVMEVTSHALDQGRVNNIQFDVAVFTNLTLDHLDYHTTMEAYCDAKQILFAGLGKEKDSKKKKIAPVAIINADSPWKDRLLHGCEATIFTFGIDQAADLMAEDIHFSGSKTIFSMKWKSKKFKCEVPLVGRYNVYNCLAATSVCLERGYSIEKILPLMAHFPPVPGRLEFVKNPLDLKIYVDFAHSDDALQNVLECLNEFKTGRLILVFGCGGDRDRGKRSKMGAIAEAYADICIITSDNPRGEDPGKICEEILTGLKKKERPLVILDRFQAIERAIDIAAAGDIVLIAGKGHETYQIFAHKTVEFDDRKVAHQICHQKALAALHA